MDSTSGGGASGVTVRAAAASDYERIVAVADDWWGRPVRQVLPRLFLDHFHATSLVAEAGQGLEDRALAGFCVGFMSPSVPDAAYIHFVGVDPRLRGRGLARVLYSRFFGLAAADGRRVVRAITSPGNRGSIAFHTAMGFTATGPIPDYDGPSVDRVLFERRLG
jgi:ribosomal protein S18 acetylase RimI-like enzyme